LAALAAPCWQLTPNGLDWHHNAHLPTTPPPLNSTNINSPDPAPHQPAKESHHQHQVEKEHTTHLRMPFPCGLNVYITVEAVTLLGLAFVAATSIIANSTMAKRKKSGSAANKPVQPGTPQNQPKVAGAPNANGAATAQQGGPSTPPPVVKEIDSRPESS
jgi:hypothetical protein